MGTEPVRSLVVHGTIVLLLGIVAGIPFWLAIILRGSEATIRAWRVAHATLLGVGLMLILVGAVVPHTTLGASLRAWLEWSLVAGGYGFVFALIGGAMVGERGLNPLPPGVNTVFFLGHAIGAMGSLAGIALLLVGLLA